ncbi:MAG: HYR domain-containing protein, partial [Bacteroidota bacterium]
QSITINTIGEIADAGADQFSVAGTSTTLSALAPTNGGATGLWTIENGDGNGMFSDATSPTSTFSGTAGQNYELRWTVTNTPCATTSDLVEVSFGDPTPLGLGDLVFTGYNSSNPDQFSFILLTDANAGTEISFTDNGWLNTGAFRSGEGSFTLTLNRAYSCSTIFLADADGGWSVSAGELGSAGSVVENGTISLTLPGDQVFAFQGTLASPTLLTGIQMNGAWDADATDSNSSAQPTGFVDGVNSLSIDPQINNAQYNCSTEMGSPDDLRIAINTAANWNVADGTPFDLGMSCDFACQDPCAMDTEDPVINCPVDITVNNDPGQCDAVVIYGLPTATDNCEVAADSETFSYTGSIETWTVPDGVSKITVEAWGAEGGGTQGTPGKGAFIRGDLAVTPGQQFKILVGQKSPSGNGGGGGTFFTTLADEPLIIAGGGGGFGNLGDDPSKDGQTGTDGGDGAGTGGTAGSGGLSLRSGGGLLTNGAQGGQAFVNGGAGGVVGGQQGGFGGGGAGTGTTRGGGGGGYSGGGGGTDTGGSGGGGGSFNAGTNQMATGGLNEGDGQLVISWTVQPPNVSQIAGFPPGSTFPLGMTTNTFVATDASGNTATCSFTLTVVDTTLPNAVCVDNLDVFLDGNGNASISFTDIENGSTDNCGIASFRLNDSTFTCSDAGMNQLIVLTVEDAAGNQDTCQTPIAVMDTIRPTVVCETAIDVALGPDSTFSLFGPFILSEILLSFNDNCAAATATVGTLPGTQITFGCDDVGNTYTSEFRFSDGNGNIRDCSTEITVTDPLSLCNQAPVAVCQDVTVDLTNEDPCILNPLAEDFDGGSTDPDMDMLSFSIDPSGPFVPGVTTVLLTVSDGQETDTCSATLTLTDTTPPVILDCPTDTTIGTDPGACTAVFEFGTPLVADDPCNNPLGNPNLG